MARPTHGKVKLTDEGVEALATWLANNARGGKGYTDLANLWKTSTSAARFIATQRMWASPKMIVELYMWSFGELTPAQLIGKEAAKRCGKLPKAPKRPATTPQAAQVAPGAAGGAGDAGADAVVLAGAQTAANINALIRMRDDPRSTPGQRARAIETLLEYGVGKPRQQEKPDIDPPMERDEDLIQALKTLVGGAKRRLEALAAGQAASSQEKKPEVKKP